MLIDRKQHKKPLLVGPGLWVEHGAGPGSPLLDAQFIEPVLDASQDFAPDTIQIARHGLYQALYGESEIAELIHPQHHRFFDDCSIVIQSSGSL